MIGSAEAIGEFGQPPFADRGAQVLHQHLVEPDIVLGHQHRPENLARANEMVEIGAAPGGADGAGAFGIERPLILGEPGVADVDRAGAREGLAGAAGAGGQHAIEHVDPALDGADDVVGLADAHQVAGLGGVELARREIEHAEHRFLALAHCQAAHRIAIEPHVEQRIRRGLAQPLVERALLDAEDRIVRGMVLGGEEGVAAALRPAHRSLHRRGLHFAG